MCVLKPDSEIANFIYSKKAYGKERRVVRSRAFDGFTSACQTDGIGPREIESIAEEYVSPGRVASLKGWAALSVRDVRDAGLTAVRDDVTYERHVEIGGWPHPGDGIEPALTKSRKMAIEKELAARSRLVLRGDY